MSKKQREQLREEFLFAVPHTQGDVGFLEIAQANNLAKFSVRLSYISASVSGGKMTTDQAEECIKDLYKAWKHANKTLSRGWKG